MTDTRYCTYCGQATKQKANNLFVCPAGHENWVNYVPGVSCFLLRDGKVLYGVRSEEPYAGGLDIPGGFVDLGENLEECAIRETKEELGLETQLIDYLGSYQTDYNGRLVLCVVFVAEITGGELQPGDDMSGGDPIWRDINDLPKESELAWQWQVTAQKDLFAWYQRHQNNSAR